MFFLALLIFIVLYVVVNNNLHKINSLEERITHLEKRIGSISTIAENVSVSTSTQSVVQPAHSSTSPQGVLVQPKPQLVDTPVHSMETFANRIARLGIIVLAIGVLYFLSYINSKGLLGQTAKFVIGLIAGATCVGIAEWVKKKSIQYAQILRGGGFIIWYITLYIGTFSYKIISLPVMLGLVIGVLFISVLVSFAEKRETSFFFGVLGAYILPWIAGATAHDASTNLQLLVYILIINCGIVGIALFKKWRASMYAGFVFTWLMFFSVYAINSGYVLQPVLTWGTLWLFATLFGLQFLVVFVSGDIRRGQQFDTEVAGVGVGSKTTEGEVFATATNTLLYVAFSYALIYEHFKNYLGFLVLFLGVFHFCVYVFIRKIQGGITRSVAALTHFVIFVVLVTAAIPIQFDGPVVTMVWFIEGIMLAYLATTNEFKRHGIMYVLGIAGIVMGIMHMIVYGSYEGVISSGVPIINQQYVVWFFVICLIHFIAYLWKNIDVQKVKTFALFLFLTGQVFFVSLTSVEIWSYYGYKSNILSDIQARSSADFQAYYGYSEYSGQATPAQLDLLEQKRTEYYDEMKKLDNAAAFLNALFFVIMTTMYLLIGLLRQNKMFRRLGVAMLAITLLQIISLAWQFGPVYRFVTFLTLGVILLILSYLYIHHSKKNLPEITTPNSTN